MVGINGIPIYTRESERYHEQSYASGDFELLVPTSGASVQFVGDIAAADVDYVDFKSNSGDIEQTESYSVATDDYKHYYVQFPALIEGARYYMKIVLTDGEVYLSEYFTATDKAITVTFENASDMQLDFGALSYSGSRNTVLCFDAELSPPEYNNLETLVQQDNVEHVKKQIALKSYSFAFIAPEFLTDFLSLARLHDSVRIQIGNKDETVRGTACKVKFDWINNEPLAKVVFTFETNRVIKKTQFVNTII